MVLAKPVGDALTTWVYAQEKVQLKGIVSTESGEMLKGFLLRSMPTTQRTSSRIPPMKGVFTVSGLLSKSKYHFVFTHVGYQAYEVKAFEIRAGVNNTLIVRMKEASSGLNEVVVIGYGSVKKKDVTGAIGSLKSDKIAEVAASDATQVLQGRVSGVMVQTLNWKPGNPSQVRIRGNFGLSRQKTNHCM